MNYYLSGNYIQQIGSVSNSEMERFTLRSNVSAQLTSFLKLTTAFNINRNIYQNGTVGGASNSRGEQASGALAAAMSYLPNMPVRDENGNYTLFKVIPNPVAMEDIQNESKNNGYNVNFTVDINIIKICWPPSSCSAIITKIQSATSTFLRIYTLTRCISREVP